MKLRLVPGALTLSALLAACGGGAATPTAAPTAEATTVPTAATVAPTAAPTTAPTAAADANWEKGVIRIENAATFDEPSVGSSIQVSGGTGFIIDQSGIALTNAHVVTKGGLVDVYLDGENKPRDAEVLGYSECSDLAVLQIKGGGPFPALRWYDGAIKGRMKVIAAGYPLDAKKINFTDGIISQDDKVSGETNWASVKSVLQHTAKILPGNSGGPLVTEDGQVVGINYAGNNANDQNYAIARAEIQPLIEQLQKGKDVGSIGINGVAVSGTVGDAQVSGVWVRAVVSGSSADKALLKPGDLIMEMEKLPLGADETMSVYCRFIRDMSADNPKTLSIKVLRGSEVLEGQINGRPLPATGVALQPSGGPSAPVPTADGSAASSQVTTLSLSSAELDQARSEHNAARGGFRQQVFETFDRGNTTRGSWYEGDSDTDTATLVSSYYTLTGKKSNFISGSTWSPNGEDRNLGGAAIIELDTAFDSSGALSGVGVMFDSQDGKAGRSYFLIRSDNTWEVITFRDGKVDSEHSTSGPVRTNTITGGVNQLRVVRTAESVELWINNTPVGTMRPAFDGGYGGVAVETDDATPVTVIVDNFRVLTR